MSAPATIQSIYRYPVKGLSPESLDGVRLEVGQTLPADRMYAIENGPSGFDPAAPIYLAKTYFLMLMKNERLALLDTLYDEDTYVLTIHGEGREMVRGDLRTKEGRLAIEAFFRRYMPAELRGPPKVLRAEGHSFSDVAAKVVSIINLASVAAIETAIGPEKDSPSCSNFSTSSLPTTDSGSRAIRLILLNGEKSGISSNSGSMLGA